MKTYDFVTPLNWCRSYNIIILMSITIKQHIGTMIHSIVSGLVSWLLYSLWLLVTIS